MADGGAGRGNFDWGGYMKIMGLLMLAMIALVAAGEWFGLLH